MNTEKENKLFKDRYNRRINYLRISVTDHCDLRCHYCFPVGESKHLRREEVLSFEEICEVAAKAVELGIDKVRLTGGEPLMRRDIVSLVVMLAKIEGIKDFAMTTNGTRLAKYARPLKDAGLHRLNISLDTLDHENYREITGGGDLSQVLAGITAAKEAGFSNIKLNCVVKDSPEEAAAQEVAKYAGDNGITVRFIRRMNTEEGEFWQVIGGDGGKCQSCGRLRMSSDGRIFPCLFSDISFSVRELGIEKALQQAVMEKPESGNRSSNKFYNIGG